MSKYLRDVIRYISYIVEANSQAETDEWYEPYVEESKELTD